VGSAAAAEGSDGIAAWQRGCGGRCGAEISGYDWREGSRVHPAAEALFRLCGRIAPTALSNHSSPSLSSPQSCECNLSQNDAAARRETNRLALPCNTRYEPGLWNLGLPTSHMGWAYSTPPRGQKSLKRGAHADGSHPQARPVPLSVFLLRFAPGEWNDLFICPRRGGHDAKADRDRNAAL
jgi:hypothetical protein